MNAVAWKPYAPREDLRPKFEDWMWKRYLWLKAQGWAAAGEVGPVREALFWREESGKYGVISIAAAWEGFIAGYIACEIDSQND